MKLQTTICKQQDCNRGFTLIEMLVVMTIIGLLSSSVLVGLNEARSRARDARRIADIRQIQNGLESFYFSNRGYPADMNSLYENIPNLPRDPQHDPAIPESGRYGYVGINRAFGKPQGYVLGVCLENNRPADVQTFIPRSDFERSIDVGGTTGRRCTCGDEKAYCVSL